MFKVGVGSKSPPNTTNCVSDVEKAGAPSPNNSDNTPIQNAN